jgi:hypothetical protein
MANAAMQLLFPPQVCEGPPFLWGYLTTHAMVPLCWQSAFCQLAASSSVMTHASADAPKLAAHMLRVMTSLARHDHQCMTAAVASLSHAPGQDSTPCMATPPTPPLPSLHRHMLLKSPRLWTSVEQVTVPGVLEPLPDVEAAAFGNADHLGTALVRMSDSQQRVGSDVTAAMLAVAGRSSATDEVVEEQLKLLVLVAAGAATAHGRSRLLWLLRTSLLGAVMACAAPHQVDADAEGTTATVDEQAATSAALLPGLQLLQPLLQCDGARVWMDDTMGQRMLNGVLWCTVRQAELLMHRARRRAPCEAEAATACTVRQCAARVLYVATLSNAPAVSMALVSSGAIAPLLRSVDADLRASAGDGTDADDSPTLQTAVDVLTVLRLVLLGEHSQPCKPVLDTLLSSPALVRSCMHVAALTRQLPSQPVMQVLGDTFTTLVIPVDRQQV